MRIRPQSSTDRRRTLRRNGTNAELVLWHALRAGQVDGNKFRRQHAVGPYILDFCCVEKGLAVEVDGDQHVLPEQAAHDERRTQFLEEQGIRVLRFSNRDVLTQRESVVEVIRGALT